MAAHSADRPPPGGYDLDIFVDKDKIGEYICQICHDVSRDCVEVSCGNGHIFCHACIRYNFKINGHSCPADRTKNISITANDFVRRKILASNVKCKYHPFHCEWIGALRQFKNHVLHCKYKPIKCKYCKASVSSQLVSEHYEECDEYLVRCSWCNDMYRRKILNEHINSCYMKPILCPNGCNETVVSNKLDTHLNDECAERLVYCSFNKYGCNQRLKYNDINKHNLDNTLQHIQYQMAWILLENERKNKQILHLKAHISQLQAPEIIFVSGSCIKGMNGIYKKQINSIDQKYTSSETPTENIEDQKKEYENIQNISSISLRAFYKKYETNWILYYNQRSRHWVFSGNGLIVDTINNDNIQCDGCCHDHALHPINIKNQTWKIWINEENKYQVTDTLTITEIDLFHQLLNTQHKFIVPVDPQQSQSHNNNDNIRFAAPQGPLFHVDETKTAVLNPAFIPNDDDKDDHELNTVSNRRNRALSNASTNSSLSSAELESESCEVSINRNNKLPMIRVDTNSNNNKWSISVAVKTKYDTLYDDLLRRESNSNHHNPFGPPMVSNETLYRYLTSVGYDSNLIKILWKLINNIHSNVNNLLTRNGFVAICHLLDKITNNNYKIPTVLPISLEPQSLDKLTSTPVHNARLNNTVFPDIADDVRSRENESGSLLTFNDLTPKQNENLDLDDVFEFNEIKEEREESKQDFLSFTPTDNKKNNMNINMNMNINLIASETMATPTVSIPNGTAMDPMLDFINARSRTKPNTPNAGHDIDANDVFLNVFPAPELMKSRSLDDKGKGKGKAKSKSTNDIFNINPNDVNGPNGPNRSMTNLQTPSPSRRRTNSNNSNSNNNNINNNNTPNFGSDHTQRNGLDDLWDESWQSSMSGKNNK